MDTRRLLHSGQIVVGQLGLVILVLGWLAGRPLVLLPAVVLAGTVSGLALGRVRGRWLYQWLALALRYLSRPHALPAGADPAALARFVTGGRPDPGETVVIELAGDGPLLAGAGVELPSPGTLIPLLPKGASVRLILTAVPARGSGALGTSYRELTGGRVPAQLRALLVVRIDGTAGRLPDRALRRLDRLGLAYTLLDPPAVATALAELTDHDPDRPARETWSMVRLGRRCQATFRVGTPQIGGPAPAELLCLPASRVTLGLAGPELAVRLTAANPTALARAERALRRSAGSVGARVGRLDGDQLGGLAGTLPWGHAMPDPPGDAPAGPADPIVLPPAGLMLGRDRHGRPVTARLFGAGPVRAVLVGGLATAQILVLRALALRARVSIRTARAAAWEPFLRAVALPGDVLGLAAADPPPPEPAQPQLIVVDDQGPPAGAARRRAILVVRDRIAESDRDLLGQADLAILQPLPAAGAELAGLALGLGSDRDWLTRIRPGMLGLVSGRSVRWVLLCPTDHERRLAGTPERVAAG
jgi:type VII secretion protein EccE